MMGNKEEEEEEEGCHCSEKRADVLSDETIVNNVDCSYLSLGHNCNSMLQAQFTNVTLAAGVKFERVQMVVVHMSTMFGLQVNVMAIET